MLRSTRLIALAGLAVGPVCCATTQAATLLVPSNFPTIQAAIDAASNGDIVQVGIGTYSENIDFLGKAITVRGSQILSFRTFIDGGGTDSVVKMVSGEGPNSVLDFVIVQNGDAVFGGGIFVGGGADPTISRVIIQNNSAALGGGAVIGFNGSPAFEDCTFRGNTTDGDGGGIYAFSGGDPLFDAVTFDNNTADVNGGGYGGVADATFLNCVFTDNTADDAVDINRGGGASVSGGNAVFLGGSFRGNRSDNTGGGLAVWNSAAAVVRDVEFSRNTALSGGGFLVEDGDALINRCTFDRNTATNFAGGLYVSTNGDAVVGQSEFLRNDANVGSALRTNSPAIVEMNNCLVHHNTGASAIDGFELTSPGAQTVITLRNCSVVENQNDGFNDVGGVAGFGAPQINIYNSILWNNQGGDFDNNATRTDIDYTRFAEAASYAGTANNSLNPMFRFPTGPANTATTPDYRLLPGSPMIDAASNFIAPLDQTDDDFDFNALENAPFDFAGSSRRRNDTGTSDTGAGSAPVIDRGAHEFQGTTTGCNPADVAPPIGTLDIDDVLAFLDDFASGDVGADIAPPFGTLNIDDLLAFLDAFAAGCP